MSWTACDTAVDFRARLRLVLQSTARISYQHKTYVHYNHKKTRTIHPL